MESTPKQARLDVLKRHIRRLDRSLRRFQELDRRFFWTRLGVLLASGLALFLALLDGRVPVVVGAVAAFLALFSLVVFFHRRLDRSVLRFQVSRRLAEVQVARMELDWAHIPPVPAALQEALPAPAGPAGGGSSHPFAADLNLIGERSIHQLLDTAGSQGGSRRLRDWLLKPVPDIETIAQRQAVLKEIGPLTGFRRRLALNGALAAGGKPDQRWDGQGLLEWLQGETESRPLRLALLMLAALAAANISLFVLNSFGLLPPLWAVTLSIYFVVYYSQRGELGEMFSDARYLSDTLEKFRAGLAHLERYPYRQGSRLARLCEPFWRVENRPSRILRRITGIAAAASLQGNPIIWMAINLAVPWDMYFAHRLRQVRQELRGLLPAWLDAWNELEALNSLADFAYLNPGYVYPQVLERSGPGSGPVFAAQELGHPLLPEAGKVCNDFSIRELGQVVIVTGSNMSGKSTFLRTVGANLALAYAGGAVNAACLSALPFRLFTCINVSDSLSDGISYFYAEVRRLKTLLVELEKDDPHPLFFLIDEIFRGTNNRERQIGSRAYLRSLAGGHGAGLISTHDLELVHLADELPGVENYHFREEVHDRRMVFDYRLRPGPSPTTNALKIMQIEGLPVDPVLNQP